MSENQKENIIRVAREKIGVAGLRSVSIDDICRELGMSKKTFYVYFKTKDELLDALLRLHEASIQESIAAKTKGKSLLTIVTNYQSLLRNINDVRQVPVVLYDLKKYYPQQLTAHLQRLRLINQEITARFLHQGIEEGLIREHLDVDATARVLASMHQIMIDKLSEAQNHPTILSDTKLAMDIFFRGLLSDAGLEQVKTAMAKNSKTDNRNK